jgi:hypothetical protein
MGPGVCGQPTDRYHIHTTHNNDMLLVGSITDNRIVDRNAFEVVVLCVVLGDESVGNVWDIIPSITFASQVHIVVVHIKCIDELFKISSGN